MTSDDNKENVVQMIEENDTWAITEHLAISQYSVCKILKEQNFHDYKAEMYHLLLEDDTDQTGIFPYCASTQSKRTCFTSKDQILRWMR